MITVFCCGCFDILHFGHFQMLKYAKSLGDLLVVAIDSDERVKELKGDSRPFHNIEQRRSNLMGVVYVDSVPYFSSDEELIELIQRISPQIRVIGEEYRNKKIIGREYSGTIEYFPHIPNFSTSKILS